ncbi:MAG TPA: hypothetical protein VF648_01760 [Pyrinomonadaceae bacterium]|jgi:hypothetical protein
MTNKKLTIISVSLLSLFLAATFAAFRQQAQDKSSHKKDESTVVQRGQFTAEERAYSKEYNKIYSKKHGLNLDVLIELGNSRGKSEVVGTALGIPFQAQFNRPVHKSPTKFLMNLSCKSDAVVVGSIKSKAAHLIENETFIYTQYEFWVEDIVKDNTASPITVNEIIQVTRPGGLIKINEQLIQAEDRKYAPLEANKKYLLFLKFVPAAKGYMVADVDGDFVLEGDSFKTISSTTDVRDFKGIDDFQALANNTRSFALADCGENTTGEKK